VKTTTLQSMLIAAGMLATQAVWAGGGSIGSSIRDLDEGTRASVVKELSKIHRYEDGKNGRQSAIRSPGQTSESCEMNVASPQSNSPTRTPTPRRAVTVVTGNIVQLCNR